MKRILKDIKVDSQSNGESIITISIWSDVAYLDKNFINNILQEKSEDEVNYDNVDKVYDNIKQKLMIENLKYSEIDITPEMNEHDIFVAEISKAIASDMASSYLTNIKPIIVKLCGNLDKSGKLSKEDMQLHVQNIIKLIDLMKSHLAYIPSLQERDKLMFKILEDVKMYAILGDKFLHIENFSNYWTIREQVEPTTSYNIGIKNKPIIPPPPIR